MKKFLIALVVIMTTVIVVLVGIIMSFDLNKYKPQIEKKFYEATGKELKIKGKIGVSFSPVGIAVNDVSIKNPKEFGKNDMFDMKKLSVSLQLKPLLNKQIKVNYIKLEDIDLSVIKSKKGILNISAGSKNEAKENKNKAKEGNSKVQLPMLNVNKVLVSNVNIFYKDLSSDTKADIEGLNLTINDISLNSKIKDILRAVSLKGKLTIKDIKYDKYLLKNILADFSFKDKIATIDPMKLTVFNSEAVGKLIYNMQKKEPKIFIKEHIAKFDLKEISKEFIKSDKISLDGYVKADIKLSMVGVDPKLIKRTLNGSVFIEGDKFGIKGIDLNKVLDSYNNFKKVNKKDLGALLVAGPIGMALTKGADTGSILKGFAGGTTAVKKLVIDAPIKRGTVTLKDVALSTGKYRVALKGKLDLPRERFVNVQIALLDKKGCATYSQKVGGTFKRPKFNTQKLTTQAVTGVVTSLFGQFKGLMPSKKKSNKCKIFYKGLVKP